MEIGFVMKSIRHYIGAFILTIIVCLILGLVANMVIPPKYKATASLLANLGSSQESSTYTEFLASEMLTKTYEEAIRSRSVAHEVKSRITSPYSAFELLNKIEVRTDPGTLVIKLYAIDKDPKAAVVIANAFVDSFISKSKLIVQNANVSVLDYADLEAASVPDSPKKLLNLALAFFIGIFSALSICLVLELRWEARRKKGRPISEIMKM